MLIFTENSLIDSKEEIKHFKTAITGNGGTVTMLNVDYFPITGWSERTKLQLGDNYMGFFL